MKKYQMLLGVVYVTSLLDAGSLHAAQVGPNPIQTEAVEGIVRRSDAAAGAVIVRAANGVDHLVHVTKRTLVHGSRAAADDAFHGLEEGSQVVVHYSAEGGRMTAVEIDHVGKDGLHMMEGRVTKIDRKGKQLAITLGDGSIATLRLTDRAAERTAQDAEQATVDTTKVLVYYTDEAGERVAHFFKRIS